MTIDNAHIKVPTIKKIDKDFPEWLDFIALRNEGLRHLGALSGKLWTDHNIHDPGITTLEVLAYAILDLGYRTSRPIENLLATNAEGQDDNFFAPHQILTNNPLTIADYRKLLVSLPEVRNAWVSVSDASKIMVKVGDPKANTPIEPLIINGLYKITIEPNFDLVEAQSDDSKDRTIAPSVISPKISQNDLIKKVNKLLNAHRNLCEDFEPFTGKNNDNNATTPAKSTLLQADPLVVKGTVLLQTNADAARIYAEIHRVIAEFIAPSPRFYTLQELLDKGKTIEEIYEGRPSMSLYFPTSQVILGKNRASDATNLPNSELLLQKMTFSELTTGFIDTDELEKIEPRKAIHISDLYNLVAQIEGVQSVQVLQLEKTIFGQREDINPTRNWCYDIDEGFVPVLQDLVLTLKQGVTIAVRTTADLSNFEKKGSNSSKGIFKPEPLPYDAPLEGLGDYYSIQRDYPRVYRIGDGGLSAQATDTEVAQVRQFKGYLLFFERILTDYLAQLTHIRDIFSILPDSQRSANQTHSYFSGSLDNVPDGNVLLRFAQSEAGNAALTTSLAVPTEGSLLKNTFDELTKFYREKPINERINNLADILLEVDFLQIFASNSPKTASKGVQPQPFSSVFQRDAVINLVRQDLENDTFDINVYEDAFGFFFTVVPSVGNTLLLSRVHYASAKQAREAAALTALMGSFSTGFNLGNHQKTVDSDTFYTFDIISSPAETVDLLSQSLENSPQYAQRRNILLDHLLARFAEQFTDYTTLLYGVFTDKTEDKARTASDKSQFLANYDQISQNRARSFDYTEGGWLSENVSGFEQRLKALSGIEDGRRHTLCPFVIDTSVAQFHVKITDATGNPLFETADAFPRDLAAAVVQSFTEGGQSVGNFTPFETASKEFGFAFQTPNAVLTHPILYASQTERDQKIAEIHAVFRQNIAENEIFVASTLWEIGLYAAKNATDLTFEKTINFLPTTNELGNDLGNLTTNELENNLGNPTTNESENDLGNPTANESKNDLGNSTTNEPKNDLSDPTTNKSKNAAENVGKRPVQIGQSPFKTATEAVNDTAVFAKNLEKHGLSLLADPQQDGVFINTAAFAPVVSTLPPVYRWHIFKNNILKESGVTETPDEATAVTDFITAKTVNEVTTCENILIFKTETGYKWSIVSNSEALLTSLAVFADRETALLNAFASLDLVRDVKRYYKSGDEFNANFTFLLRNESNRFVAQYPHVFAKEKERTKALKNVQNLLKNAEKPLQTPAEPPRYIWTLSNEKEAVLKSFSYFDTEEKAFVDFDLTLHLAGKIAHCKIKNNRVNSSKSNSYTFDVLRNRQPCATSTTSFDSLDDCGKAMGGMIQQIANHRYIVQAREYPDRYKFQYFALPSDAEPLFVSEKDFGSAAEATEGFTHFVQNLHTKSLKDNGLHTRGGERAAQVSGVYERALGFVEDVKKLRNTEGSLDSAVQKSARSMQGAYVYRMLDKDAPLAFAMNKKVVLTGTNDAVEAASNPTQYTVFEANTEGSAEGFLNEISKKNTAACPVLSLCLDGDNVMCIGNQWFYVLKSNRLNTANNTYNTYNTHESYKTYDILFVSWQGYDTEAEAHAAFAQNYVGDITAATNLANYDAPNGIFYTQVSPNIEAENAKIEGESADSNIENQKSEGENSAAESQNSALKTQNTEGSIELPTPTNSRIKYRVFVPKGTAKRYSKAQLATFAQNYPLREIVEKGKKQYIFAQNDCKSGDLIWQSADKFETTDAALATWQRFHAMLNVAGSCRLSRANNCAYNIALYEILLESKNNFESVANAWGNLPDSNIPFEGSIAHLTESASKADALYVYQDENRVDTWSFLGISPCFRLATSPLLFSSAQECKQFLTDLAAAKPNKLTISLENGVKKAIFTQKYTDKTVVPCGCPEKPSFELERDITLLNFLNATGDCLQVGVDFLQKIENYRIVSASKQSAYTFELVDSSQILARHPLFYTTRFDTDATLKRAEKCLNTEGVHIVEKILLRPRTSEECVQNADASCRLPYQNTQNTFDVIDLESSNCDVCPPVKTSSSTGDNNTAQTAEYLPDADPYSFILKVVMPLWGKRFGNSNFRKELERLLAHESPAHLWLDIEYKNAENLCAFETEYRQWLCDFSSHQTQSNLLGDCPSFEDVTRIETDTMEARTLESTPSVSLVSEASKQAISMGKQGKSKEKSVKTTTSSKILGDKKADKRTDKIVPKAENKVEKTDTLTNKIVDKTVDETENSEALVDKTADKTRDNDRFIRSRLMQYSENIKVLADAKLEKTESYKQSTFFLQNDGNVKALEMLVDLITKKSMGKKGGATDEQYTALLQNALGYALDKLVVSAPNAVQQAEILRGIVGKLIVQNIDIESFMKNWHGEEWTERLDATVAEAYKAIFLT